MREAYLRAKALFFQRPMRPEPKGSGYRVFAGLTECITEVTALHRCFVLPRSGCSIFVAALEAMTPVDDGTSVKTPKIPCVGMATAEGFAFGGWNVLFRSYKKG
jgi:hypothetical protein